MADSQLAALRAIPLFEDLDDALLERVLACTTEFEVNAGHVLIQPEHAGEGLFIIEDGTVRIDLPGRSLELGGGEVLGELALLTEDARHTGRVVAVTAVRGLALRRDDFDSLLNDEAQIGIRLLKVVAGRLAAADSR